MKGEGVSGAPGWYAILPRYRHASLLASLLLLILVRPFLGERALSLVLLEILLLVTLLTCVFVCAASHWERAIGIFLAAAIECALQWRGAIGAPLADTAFPALGLLFFSYVSGLMLRQIFVRSRHVSADSISGALSVYLLIGLAWAFAYALLEVVEPDSFSFQSLLPVGTIEFERFMGFSFVTLTTLGYGNVVPLTPRAEALATTEAIVGQIYLTVLVARLVALHLAQSGGGASRPAA